MASFYGNEKLQDEYGAEMAEMLGALDSSDEKKLGGSGFVWHTVEIR